MSCFPTKASDISAELSKTATDLRKYLVKYWLNGGKLKWAHLRLRWSLGWNGLVLQILSIYLIKLFLAPWIDLLCLTFTVDHVSKQKKKKKRPWRAECLYTHCASVSVYVMYPVFKCEIVSREDTRLSVSRFCVSGHDKNHLVVNAYKT